MNSRNSRLMFLGVLAVFSGLFLGALGWWRGNQVASPALPTLLPTLALVQAPTQGQAVPETPVSPEPRLTSVALSDVNEPTPNLDEPNATQTPVTPDEVLASPEAESPLTRLTATSTPPRVQIIGEVRTSYPPIEPVPDVVVLSVSSSATTQERADYVQALEAAGAQVESVGALGSLVVSLPLGMSAQSLPESSVVAQVEADYYVLAQDDPLSFQQWNMDAIGARTLWRALPVTLPNVLVAVIDSGVNAAHPDLVGQVLGQYDFIEDDDIAQDELGHGTAVAGLIASAHNLTGISGVAPNARILALRVLDGRGLGRYSDVAQAIVYAADQGAQVINLSLGGLNESSLLQSALDYALAKGVQIVAASGNSGASQPLYPARYAPVISVGAVDENGQVASFSNAGADVLAPGVNVLANSLDGGYAPVTGTSFSAPHVSGALALGIALGQMPSLEGDLLDVANMSLVLDLTPAGTPIDLTPPDLLIGETSRLTGTIGVLHGDPSPESGGLYQAIAFLYADDGTTYELQGFGTQYQAYHTKRVEVDALLLQASGLGADLMASQATLEVSNIRVLDEVGASALTGSQNVINVRCRFSDQVIPANLTDSYYNSLMANSAGGLDHYWRSISYNNINLLGSVNFTPWYTINTRSSYIVGEYADLDALAQDCLVLADPSYTLRNYEVINLMFNADLDCCAWGGGAWVNVEGGGFYPITWMPPWGQTTNTIAHEMGHVFGLPHSSGPLNNPPSGLSIYVSNWDLMSRGGPSSSFPVGVIAPYASYYLDWIPSNRVQYLYVGQSFSGNLERLHLAPSGTEKQLIIVPINNRSDLFYSIEVRDRTNTSGLNYYDRNVPGTGVIIHQFDQSRSGNSGPALVVDADTTNTNVNDAGAMWTVGESYVDSANGISISVVGSYDGGFSVEVRNRASIANDRSSGALNIPASPLPFTLSPLQADVHLASNDGDPSMSCSPTRYNTVWYRFTPSVTRSYTLSTAPSNYDTVLAVYNSGLSQLACNDDFGGQTSLVSLNMTQGQTYFIAIASYNLLTGASGARLGLTLQADPPAQAALNLPSLASSVTTARPAFSWFATHGATAYEFQLDASNGTFVNAPILRVTGTTYTPPNPLMNTQYAWRVRALIGTEEGAWSSVRTLTVNDLSATPILNYISDSTPTLTWSAVLNAQLYEVQLSQNSTFSAPTTLNTTDAELTLAPLFDGSYFWRVRARLSNGTWSAWSATTPLTLDVR